MLEFVTAWPYWRKGSIFGKSPENDTECKQLLSFESRRGMVADLRGAWRNGCNRGRGFMLLIRIHALAGGILAKLGSFNFTCEKKNDSGEAQSARRNQWKASQAGKSRLRRSLCKKKLDSGLGWGLAEESVTIGWKEARCIAREEKKVASFCTRFYLNFEAILTENRSIVGSLRTTRSEQGFYPMFALAKVETHQRRPQWVRQEIAGEEMDQTLHGIFGYHWIPWDVGGAGYK